MPVLAPTPDLDVGCEAIAGESSNVMVPAPDLDAGCEAIAGESPKASEGLKRAPVVVKLTCEPDVSFAIVDHATFNGYGSNFVVTYDLRIQAVPLAETPAGVLRCLRRFLDEEPRASKLREATLIAVLLEANVFAEATIAFLGELMTLLAPSCPFCISHSELTAENFFRIRSCAEGARNDFVSMVGVSSASAAETCVASLAPVETLTESRPRTGSVEAPPIYHTMTNGDLRVIQSPAADVMESSLSAFLSSVDYIEDFDDSSDGSETGDLLEGKELAALNFCSSAAETPSVEALHLRGPANILTQLLGVHFSVAELLIDADQHMFASMSKPKQRTSSKASTTRRFHFQWLRACLEGVLKVSIGV